MANKCGGNEFLQGGTILDSTGVRLHISDSTITGSVIDNAEVNALRSIDEASAGTIADAIAALPDARLAALLQKLTAAMVADPSPTAPPLTEAPNVPTSIVGDRDTMMGAPAAWLKFGSFVFPAYSPR